MSCATLGSMPMYSKAFICTLLSADFVIGCLVLREHVDGFVEELSIAKRLEEA
jgi:hypothetical protein